MGKVFECAEEAPSMAQSQRQVAAALCRAAFPGAADVGPDPKSALAAFNITDASGPPLAARLLRLRTQVLSDPSPCHILRKGGGLR